MYSQQWFPAPSTTATAPEFRTANRSPARPAAKSVPPVAPYNAVLPRITWCPLAPGNGRDRKSTRLNSSHGYISYAVFRLKKKKKKKYEIFVEKTEQRQPVST